MTRQKAESELRRMVSAVQTYRRERAEREQNQNEKRTAERWIVEQQAIILRLCTEYGLPLPDDVTQDETK